MAFFCVLFSREAEDIMFARKASPMTCKFASDISILWQISEKSQGFTVLAAKNCVNQDFISLIKNKFLSYSEYNDKNELKSLLMALYEKEKAKSVPVISPLSPTYSSLIGSSIAMNELRQSLVKISAYDVSVILLGETGTGKTTVAKAIHELSPRREKPFRMEVLSTSNESLIESRLFGVAKGGFTGAVESKGIFEEADGGTVFLDEIGEISRNFQTKLLQVLSEGIVRRIGSHKDILVDNRMIFATNANIEAKIKRGEFREDLFYRINDVILRLPPLRERLDDIPELCYNFLQKNKINKQISDAAIKAMQSFTWRGNIRQLEKCIKNAALIYSESDTIEPEDLHLY
ncbi:MAG: sigma-54-dependent Fis family transcriptional regulator [Treponema sp.]|nr:sigma-54-dependent Fis family transcriptional regulator [Treponema sp.]